MSKIILKINESDKTASILFKALETEEKRLLYSLAACRLPLAACRLPLAACRLPLAACRLLSMVCYNAAAIKFDGGLPWKHNL
jgi:hypothetical protein